MAHARLSLFDIKESEESVCSRVKSASSRLCCQQIPILARLELPAAASECHCEPGGNWKDNCHIYIYIYIPKCKDDEQI